ncbi:MAG: choline BCCT transporter BetT [Pseudomonadales bacterium]
MSDSPPTTPSGSESLVTFNPPVFYVSTILLVLLVVIAAIAPERTGTFFQAVQDGITANLSWYYVLIVAIILISVTIFSLSRYGDIKLGPDHSEPDYSYISWFAMMFAAGMGIGLMFFGVAEPTMHFLDPPRGEPGTAGAASDAMQLTFFHWGLHAWGIYAIVALVLAYFAYRHDLPLTLRSALYPLIGEKIYGPIGHAVDIFAILGTACGVATSLGFGVLQINSGLNYLFGVPVGPMSQVVLIVVTMAVATVSVVLGLDVGIKRLSELNIMLAIILMIAVLSFGPTVLLLQTFMQNTGSYISELVSKTFNLYAYNPTDWLGGWTIFYWGWWLSWSPFVGLFIARISYGRTIREFTIGALLVPTGFTLLWMTVFGNSAIELILHGGMASLGEAVQADESVALFQFLEHFPFAQLLSFVAVLMVLVFFVTSADSGAMVLNMLSSHGRDDTPWYQRVFWTTLIGLIALVLLLADGVKALQTAAITSALPFSVALLVAMWGFYRGLRADDAKREALMASMGHTASWSGTMSWRQRLRNVLSYPSLKEVREFQSKVVMPALHDFAEELRENGCDVHEFDKRDDFEGVGLEVYHGDELDFQYQVIASAHPRPERSLVGMAMDDLTEDQKYYRAEVHLREGGQNYDMMGWTREQITNDLLEQYAKHLHYLHHMR